MEKQRPLLPPLLKPKPDSEHCRAQRRSLQSLQYLWNDKKKGRTRGGGEKGRAYRKMLLKVVS